MDLKLAISVFRANNKFEVIQLWGRIRGLYNDYYVIVGMNFPRTHSFPQREYFWSYEDFKFAPLLEPHADALPELLKINTYFFGEHHKVLKQLQSQASLDFDPENLDRKSPL